MRMELQLSGKEYDTLEGLKTFWIDVGIGQIKCTMKEFEAEMKKPWASVWLYERAIANSKLQIANLEEIREAVKLVQKKLEEL